MLPAGAEILERPDGLAEPRLIDDVLVSMYTAIVF